METNNKKLYYKSLSKFKLVEIMKERGDFKYLYSMTKGELIQLLCEMDSKKEVCKCSCGRELNPEQIVVSS